MSAGYGTENDRVNCSFYYKIGACRHGEKCSRKHIKPLHSHTILCSNMWMPQMDTEFEKLNNQEKQERFEQFYEDFYTEACKFGQVEEVVICENSNDHLMGNVYAKFKYEDDARKAAENINSRWYDGRPVYCELSPVSNFREACCRQHDTHECSRGGLCNFIHQRKPSYDLIRNLEAAQQKYLEIAWRQR